MPRAYGYFAEPERSYADFAAGYADTARVELSLGAPAEEGAAGSLYSTVPLAIRATDGAGGTQVFAGCVTTRQIQPAIQDPPYRPIQIVVTRLAATDGPFEAAVPAECPPD